MFKIAIQGIKGQRSMSVLMVTVLILSFLFLTLTSAVTTSVDHTQQLERERMYGRHQMLYYGSEETAQELQGAFPGAQASLTVGTTQSGQNVATISGSFQQLANLTLSEGTLPQKADEILLVGSEWGYQVGDQIPVEYVYSCIREEPPEDLLEQHLLRAFHADRDGYLQKIAPMWDQYIGTEFARKDQPPEMLCPVEELTQEQQEYAFLLLSSGLPDFWSHGETVYSSQYEQLDGLEIEYQFARSKLVLVGDGFGDAKGTEILSAEIPSSIRIHTTYTVSGIAQEYAGIRNVEDLPMPQAFVVEAEAQRVRAAQETAFTRYPGIKPYSMTAQVLFYDGGTDIEPMASAVIQRFNELHKAAYRLTGVSYEGTTMKAYLTGLDPETGEQKTYDVLGADQMGYIQIEGQRQYFRLSDLENPAFRIPGLDPMPTEPMELNELYQSGTGPLRVNTLSYPPAGDSARVMQLALSGILIGMSACASFQLYLQAMRKRRQKMDTLIAIGATDGQILGLFAIEVSVFLLTAAVIGCLTGMGLAMALVPNVLHAQLYVDVKAMAAGGLCNAAAILVGALLPVASGLKPRRKKLSAHHRPVKHMSRGDLPIKTGYRQIWVRHSLSNPKQTAMCGLVVGLMAAIMLLPLILSHTAYRQYYAQVVNRNRPGYELMLPYAAPGRYQREIMDSIEFPHQQVRVHTSGENVLLHCTDEMMEGSPVLQALRQSPNSDMLFSELPEDGTGMYVRMVAADWESELVQNVLRQGSISVDEEEFLRGDACIVMMPRYHSRQDAPVMEQVSAQILEQRSADSKAGALVSMSYQPQYRGVYATEDGIAVGDDLQISGWTQSMTGDGGLETRLNTAQCRVAGVVSQLQEAVWPFSDTDHMGYVTILCAPELMSAVYPSTYVRQSPQQTQHFWAASELFYPDCYGKTYFQIYEPEKLDDPGAYEKQILDFAEQYGMRVRKYHMENEKLLSSARRSGAMYLMMGVNILLVTAILLGNLLSAEQEHDRKRLGILQAMGMTDGQYVCGQSMRMLLMGLVSLAAVHLLVLAAVCVGAAFTADGAGGILCQLKLMLQFYPWPWHGALCAGYLVLIQALQIRTACAMGRTDPSKLLK